MFPQEYIDSSVQPLSSWKQNGEQIRLVCGISNDLVLSNRKPSFRGRVCVCCQSPTLNHRTPYTEESLQGGANPVPTSGHAAGRFPAASTSKSFKEEILPGSPFLSACFHGEESSVSQRETKSPSWPAASQDGGLPCQASNSG